MGFEPQINKIVFEVDMPKTEKRQNLLFSATFSSEVKKMARNLMNEYYFISTYKESNTNVNIKHILVYSNEEQKCFKLHMIMQQIQGSVISKNIVND
jgi:superfamily II DNA/RNA helicase